MSPGRMPRQPFQGTVPISPDLITEADPTALRGIEYTGRGVLFHEGAHVSVDGLVEDNPEWRAAQDGAAEDAAADQAEAASPADQPGADEARNGQPNIDRLRRRRYTPSIRPRRRASDPCS